MFRLLATMLLALHLTDAVAVAQRVDYQKDVKPILQHKCYACHGVLKQQGNLRLDTGASLIRGGDSGSPIDLIQPEASLLYQVITGDAGFQMPPENEGAPLTKDQRDLVLRWIRQGAKFPTGEEPQKDPLQWWSYRPITRPTIPQHENEAWNENPIDALIHAKRLELKLPHVSPASKSTWLRLVYIDLIGLPPTVTELNSFLNDDSSAAHERVVDDLLSRPQYGERWGRHWMDIWRYSDWYGSRGINEIRYSQRHIWRWRDWIVNSLNDDKGYDRMIQEMLAADELAGHDKDTVVATGYLGRNWYKFDRNVSLFDTVERTSEAFLGLTFKCARCHDHKYDPITQEEYYRFRAFFEPHHVRTDPISATTETEKDATLGQVLSDGLPVVFDKEPYQPTYRFDRGDDRFPDETKPLTPGVPKSLGGAALSITPINLPTESWYPILREGVRETLIVKARREVEAAETLLQQATEELKHWESKLAERLSGNEKTEQKPTPFIDTDFSKPNPELWETLKGNWVYENGHLALKDATSFATIATKENHPPDFSLQLKYKALASGTFRSVGFSYDFIDTGTSQDVYTSTNDNRQTVQAFHRVNGKQTYPSEGIVYTELNVGDIVTLDVTVMGTSLTVDLDGQRKLDYELPIDRQDGRFSLWVHSGAAEFHHLTLTALFESQETIERRIASATEAVELAKVGIQVAQTNLDAVQARLNAAVSDFLTPSAQTADLKRAANQAESRHKIEQARYDLIRLGQQPQTDEQKKAIEAAQLQLEKAQNTLIHPTTEYTALGETHKRISTGRRTALAHWITSETNPRTARVAVNHLWGRHFGQPLVATTENFGLNGKTPTHPELLDWLAAELIQQQWKMKPIHKMIVLSNVYRMETHSIRSAKSKDPNNKFLWRMNSKRMEAEVIRDSILYLSGTLDLTRGGPELPEDEGQTVARRSMYFRNTPNEKMAMLEVFDVADPNSCYLRKESVVPHQALALMNSDLAQSNARIIARQLSGTDTEFITNAFETVLCRKPLSEELRLCQTFLDNHAKLLSDDVSLKFPAASEPTQSPAADVTLRARENLIHVLLLHNDFVTVR